MKIKLRHRPLIAVVALALTPALGLPALAQTAPAPDAAAPATTAVPGKAVYGTWGVDLGFRDLSVKPGDAFDRYAWGAWEDRTEIPADRPVTGGWIEVIDRTQNDLKDMLSGGAGTKYGALYASFMDEARIEQVGLKPLLEDVAAVRAIQTKRDFARFMGATNGRFGVTLIEAFVYADTADPTLNSLYLSQGGLGLPDREYYLSKQFEPQRKAYRGYIERTLRKLGVANPAKAADQVMAFETAVAEKSWAAAERRDITRLNNPLSSPELAMFAPGIEWVALFEGANIPPQQRLIATEKTAIRDLAAIYEKTPLDVLKLWQEFHLAHQASPYLNKAMVESRFEFTRTLSGVSAIQPRWKRATTLVDSSLGELVGQDYVKLHFPPEAKAKMEALVANLKLAMGDRIRSNDWMSARTKEAALEKLARMDVMVGYPDKFRDYSALQIDAGDLYGNAQRAGTFNADYAMADLGKKVDRKKWGMNPQTVNAYNGGLENKIVFPAGILQAPFFDPNADDAVNYGAIGAVIGHEITHGFDDEGRKIDANGAVRDWWAEGDGERFEAQAKIFGAQYAKYEAAPGAFVNPDLTMGENIADFAGLLVAYDGYRKSLNGQEAPVIDGMTGDQRFFLAWANAWRTKAREDAIRQQVTADPHSPDRFRAIGPLRNIEAWYKAFDVKPGDKMYIPPEQRPKLW